MIREKRHNGNRQTKGMTGMNNENTNHENTKAAATDNAANAAKYTRLPFRRAVAVLDDAAEGGFFDERLAERVREEAVIDECEDNPGTWFVWWRAKTWREAAAFAAAIVGAAFARGLYADPSEGWDTGLASEDGGRFVDVFVAAADFMTDDGTPARMGGAESEGGVK